MRIIVNRIEPSNSSIKRVQNDMIRKVGSPQYLNTFQYPTNSGVRKVITTQDENRPIVAHEVVIM